MRPKSNTRQHRRILRAGIVIAATAVLASAVHPYGTIKKAQDQSEGRQIMMDNVTAAIFSRSCVNCHSNDTTWPWYSYVPPASWMIERDVAEGRSHFNASRWGTYNRDKKREILADIARVASNREMPAPQYLLFHRDARLSNQDVQALISWASEQRRALRNKSEKER